ncbi:MAG: prolipoprotein diacylglyceryl transferase [Desulfobacteraceae bacterium 4572_130]|nr:MAG: prolipoprotein diacylglyceryl transferase [Desulfobacteraceae bacterium 4572_130]
MHPVLFKISFFTIYTYGVFFGISFIVGLFFATRQAKKYNISSEEITDIVFVILISSIVGARFFYVFLNFSDFTRDYLSIFKIWNGGFVFYGGFIFAVIASFIYIRKKRILLGQIADILAPSIAISHSIGRIGCFFAGCCYGKESNLPWAVIFKNSDSLAPIGIYLHPTQIYSVLSNLFIFFILLWIEKRKRFNGMVFWFYIMLYGIFRFFIEIFRGDPRGHLLDFLSTSQTIGILMVLSAVCMLFFLSKNKK